jgi:hypothetical protein
MRALTPPLLRFVYVVLFGSTNFFTKSTLPEDCYVNQDGNRAPPWAPAIALVGRPSSTEGVNRMGRATKERVGNDFPICVPHAAERHEDRSHAGAWERGFGVTSGQNSNSGSYSRPDPKGLVAVRRDVGSRQCALWILSKLSSLEAWSV